MQYYALSDDSLNKAIADFHVHFAEIPNDGLINTEYAGIIEEGIKRENNIDKVVGKTDSGSSSPVV